LKKYGRTKIEKSTLLERKNRTRERKKNRKRVQWIGINFLTTNVIVEKCDKYQK